MIKNLDKFPLFKTIKSEECEVLLQDVPKTIKTYVKGDLIALAGDPVQSAYILVEGRLKGEMVDYIGNRLKIETIEAPTFVAAAFLFGHNSDFPVNLTALSDVRILLIKKIYFTELLSKHPVVMKNYLDIVSSKAQFLSKKITFLSLKTIRHKIAYFLLNRMDKETQTVFVGQSQSQLSEMFGVARPSLARTIGELEKEGVIGWNRKEVKVHCLVQLKEVLNS